MAQYTDVNLDVINDIAIDSTFRITLLDQQKSSRIVHDFSFVPKRVKAGQISVGAMVESTLVNFVRAVNLDNPAIFKAELVSGKRIKIGVLDPNLQVVDVGSFNPVIGGPIFNPDIVVFPITLFNITSITFLSHASSPCSHVRVRVTTNQPMTARCINYGCIQINTSSVEFIVSRGSSTTFNAVRNSTNITQIIQAPVLLTIPEVSVTNTPFGATAVVNFASISGLELKYSLDNINWQNQNVFSGLDV